MQLSNGGRRHTHIRRRCSAAGRIGGRGASPARPYLVQLSRWLSSMQRSSPKRRFGLDGGGMSAARVTRRSGCCCSSDAAAAARVSCRGGGASRGAPRRRSGGATAVTASWKPAAAPSAAAAASGGDALARKPRPAASKLGRAGASRAGKPANASMEGRFFGWAAYRRNATPHPPSANAASDAHTPRVTHQAEAQRALLARESGRNAHCALHRNAHQP